MPNESHPVNVDEIVFRRVLDKWYDSTAVSPDDVVDRQAFRPTDRDINGLTVFRALFVSPQQVAEHGVGVGRYCVAELPVRVLEALGLTVIPDPIDDLPGHALIPEVRCGLVGPEKKTCKDLQLQLARIAGHNITYVPSSW